MAQQEKELSIFTHEGWVEPARPDTIDVPGGLLQEAAKALQAAGPVGC